MISDAVVIGSGFGGALAAHALVHAGLRVTMIERGGWVSRGPENWRDGGAGLVTPYYSMESPYDVWLRGRRQFKAGLWQCVGGQSVFFGGAAFRFRVRDFEQDPELVGDSGAEWPFRYEDLEPFYTTAERLLGVSGDDSGEPGAPPRSACYPHGTAPIAPSAQRIADAARRLGFSPSRIPLAIAYEPTERRTACIRCGNCDGYACAAEAKNDIASMIIPDLIQHGMVLRTNTVCTRLVREHSRITEVHCVNRVTGARECLTARTVILAAGTLATPHLLLASGLERENPAGDAVGRYLTRHRNVAVFGIHVREPNAARVFDKQIAILDLYDRGGSIQQISPPIGLVRAYVPKWLRAPAALVAAHAAGLVAIAEDQPRFENCVTIDPRRGDRFGLPRLRIDHAYSARDEQVSSLLVDHAKRVLREAGARFTIVRKIETFTHALGTVRMGRDPRTSPLDGDGRYRGTDNLYVVDGSALPRSAGVNPSLSIAANALRIGSLIATFAPTRRSRWLRVVAPRFTPLNAAIGLC